MAEEMRSMIIMVDPEEQKKMEEANEKENKEYLIAYVIYQVDEMIKDWQIITGKLSAINFIRGIIEENVIDLDESFILVDSENINLSDRISLRDFITKVVNVNSNNPIEI